MLELTQRLLEAAEGGEPVVVASVLEPGPTDLVPGSRLLIERDGRRIGTLGSAALDDLLANHAEGMFARHAAETLYVTETGLSDRTVVGATSIYAEVLESKPVFVVVGAGHIGRSLVKLADFLDFHVVAIDDRDDFADPERLPEADQVLCGEYEEALQLCEAQPTYYTRIVAAALPMVGTGFSNIEKAAEGANDGEAVKLFTKIGHINFIASIAPMLGLLGTVWGMMFTFAVLAHSAERYPGVRMGSELHVRGAGHVRNGLQ